MRRVRGKIKWYSEAKGFGWITLDSGEEIYVHFSALRLGQRKPEAGLSVELHLTEGPAGKQAIHVIEALR